MNPGQFLLLIVVLVLGFAGVFVSPVFWAGLLVVGALWAVWLLMHASMYTISIVCILLGAVAAYLVNYH